MVLTFASLMAESMDDLVFHFNFKDANGKNSWMDETGKFEAKTENGFFSVSETSLRIADGARIFIKDVRQQKSETAMTVMAWVLKCSTPDACPILTKGEVNGKLEFGFSLGYKFPSLFLVNNSSDGNHYGGLWYTGSGWGSSTIYPYKEWLKDPANLFINRANPHESSGEWHHVAGVFDNGKVKLYIDGKLTAEKQSNLQEKILPNNMPFCIGGFPMQGGKYNYQTADVLMNDLRLYSVALSQTQIHDIIQTECKKYPENNFIPKGATHLNALPPCGTYWPPEIAMVFDPEMKKTLKSTLEFEHNRTICTPRQNEVKAEIKRINGVPGLLVDDKQIPPLAAILHPTDWRGRKDMHKLTHGIRNFAAGKINIIGLTIPSKVFWKDDARYDWLELDKYAAEIIKSNPSAAILVEYIFDPPPWFIQKYPEELEKSYKFSNIVIETNGPPLGSDLWHSKSQEALHALVTHIENQSYGKYVIAYNPAGGESGEWYWPGAVYGHTPGFSEATCKTFRIWLKEKYLSNQALQKAWNSQDVTLENAMPPTIERYRKKYSGTFLDSSVDMPVIDFRRYMTDRTVNVMKDSLTTVKSASKNKKLTVVFSGYDLSLAAHKILHSGLSGSWQISNFDNLDMICSLIEYGDPRLPGGSGLRVNAFDMSNRLAGKLAWQEDDPRTHLYGKAETGATRSLEETISVLKRFVGHTVIRNTGAWWRLFDSYWFHQDEIILALQKSDEIVGNAIKQTNASRAQIAVIFDEDVNFFISPRQDMIGNFGMKFYDLINRSGAVSDYYYQNDIVNSNMPDYKVYFFISSYYITPEKVKVIHQKLIKNNAIAVWCYAPGALGEKLTIDLDNMTALTGQKFKMEDYNGKITGSISQIGYKKLGDIPPLSGTINPVFFAIDGEPLMTDKNNNAVMSIKKLPGWTSIHTLLPLEIEHIRAICQMAKIHLYTDGGDQVMANENFLLLHTNQKRGDRTIRLDGIYDVTELFSGKLIGKGISSYVEKDLPPGTTRLYQLSK